MPFIEMGNEFGDTKEPEVAPEGREYDLVCREIDEHEKEGKKSIRVQVNIEDAETDYQTIFHYLALPHPTLDQRNDEEKGHKPGTTTKTKMLMIKRFLTAFGVPYTNQGFNPQDIPGSRARLPLKQQLHEGRRSNVIVLPELPGEVSTGGGGSAPGKKQSKVA